MLLYRIIVFLISPFIFIHYIARLFRGRETLQSIADRFAFFQHERPKGEIIWMHGVSVGEVSVVINIIKIFQQQKNIPYFLVTTSTQSSKELFKNSLLKNSCHVYAPLDMTFVVKRFIRHWRPKTVVFIDSELWPNLIFQIAEEGIPILLFNARMSDDSYKKWLFFQTFIKNILKKFYIIAACSKRDYNYYNYLSEQNTILLGNLKYAAPSLNCNTKNLRALRSKLSSKRIWVAASLHAAEERQILDTHNQLKKEIKNLFTVIVPRHPIRRKSIELMLRKDQISYICNIKAYQERNELMLVSEIGVLGDYFRISEIVFIGGTFAKIGGHNLLEPSKLRCAILMGPFFYNFQDITESVIAKDAVRIVHGSKELSKELSLLMRNDDLRATLVQNAFDASQRHGDVIHRVVEEIQKVG